MPGTVVAIADVETLAFEALASAGAREEAARSLARAVAAAEADGLPSHGLAYVPTYCEHLRCNKVNGKAVPTVSRPKPSVIVVDAKSGFAHPAIDAGFQQLLPAAREQGVAVLAIRNSYNCGVLGYHTERIAQAGLIGLGFTHAPASIAPVGGRRPVFGTNPISLAVPDGAGGAAICIDQSASVIAKSEIMRRKRAGETIPVGWAFGPDGKSTTDPDLALKGTMAPAGGYKGVGVALMVEVMAAAASGAVLSIDASPFSGPAGGPPRTGQFFVAIDAETTSGGLFGDRIASLLTAIEEQEGVRLPGSRRAAARRKAEELGVAIRRDLVEQVRAGIRSATAPEHSPT